MRFLPIQYVICTNSSTVYDGDIVHELFFSVKKCARSKDHSMALLGLVFTLSDLPTSREWMG